MLELSILDLLYLILSFFITIIWTLLIIVLLRILKILWPIVEITNMYNKIKQLLSAYAQIPQMIKEKILSLFEKKDGVEKKEEL